MKIKIKTEREDIVRKFRVRRIQSEIMDCIEVKKDLIKSKKFSFSGITSSKFSLFKIIFSNKLIKTMNISTRIEVNEAFNSLWKKENIDSIYIVGNDVQLKFLPDFKGYKNLKKIFISNQNTKKISLEDKDRLKLEIFEDCKELKKPGERSKNLKKVINDILFGIKRNKNEVGMMVA